MEISQLTEILSRQGKFFVQGKTRSIGFRRQQLKALRNAIKVHEKQLFEALWADLHKSEFEAYASEIGMVYEEIGYHLRNVKRWAKDKRVCDNLLNFKSKTYIHSEPFGKVLIIAPWNYPFNLLFMPLIGAISTGNTAVLKTSPNAPHTAAVMEKIITSTFDADYIAIFHGGRKENQSLLSQKFDYIFFTGSPYLGKIVMEYAAKNLTPVTLELGGKSPCIVHCDAKTDTTARRIVWGKFLNAGQTCIAPDYLLVHKDIKAELLEKIKQTIHCFFGENPKDSPDFPRVVNQANVERLKSLMQSGKIVAGGETDIENRYIAPTIIDGIKGDEPIMQQEIFGPLLPVIEYSEIQQALDFVRQRPKPLAFYFFSESKKLQNRVIAQSTSGGAAINDTIMHIANHNLPFGGVGNSGMGRYHGKYSFDTLSNKRAIIRKTTLFDVPLRYAPYKNSLKLVRKILK